MNANRTLKLTTLALCGVINILGGTIALLLRLPVYLDSIGTVLAAALFGPVAGLVPGLISGLISGMTSDVYAFYYIPVQLILGLEIMVNDSLGHTLTAAYIVNGTGSISLFREFLQRALHNPVFCLLIFLFPLHEHSPPKLLTTRSIYD